MNRRIKKIILFLIIFNLFFIVYSSKTFARSISEDINSINDSEYPGIKAQIQALQKNHPQWIFKVEYTNLTWEEVINGEHQGHSASVSPSNLVPANSPSYGGLWICEICGTQKHDTGSWYCSSKEALEYMMDPRNSLNEKDLFQFMQLSGFENFDNETVRNVLKNMTKNYSWIDGECIDATIQAANTYHVDPYYIMAKILEEQSGTSPLYTGSGCNGSYEGFFNVFNIGATATTGNRNDVILNGLAYAAQNNWNSKTASILGGVNIISSNYIAKEQDTLYYQKYDVIGDSKYEHQYQQNVLGAQTAGANLKKLYSTYDPTLSGNYSFIIPLYKNTPVEACPRPNVNQSHVQNSVGLMGDINGDNEVNVLDVVMLINYLNGNEQVESSKLPLAKVSGNSDITVLDVVMLINYLNGDAVLPNDSFVTGTLNTTSKVRLTPNGVEFNKSIASGTSIKILKLATEPIDNIFWDLVVGANGVYGYIPRNYYN